MMRKVGMRRKEHNDGVAEHNEQGKHNDQTEEEDDLASPGREVLEAGGPVAEGGLEWLVRRGVSDQLLGVVQEQHLGMGKGHGGSLL